MTTVELINWAADYLDSAGIPSARHEVEDMLSHVLKISRLALYIGDIIPDTAERFEFENIVKKRAKRAPLQYLLGNTNFMGFDFKVKPGVFIPRPETEMLVEEALKILEFNTKTRWTILDLCSGSGNISISLTKSVSNCRMLAVDISMDAIEIARENAKSHGVGERIEFYHGDMFSAVGEGCLNRIDMIVSNPPYIPANLLNDLSPEVRVEPRVAIDGGDRGLTLYRRIISEGSPYLHKGGWLLMEMGDGQAEEIRSMLQESRVFNVHEIIRDYNGMMRVIIARKDG
ncbi:MAG: peptide chain release factor N(5)-glutamine methyltransferase [Candidatus Omnitrophica bacterium]|nr:peptide chain release factor N(5)-glutamine methyltransferase [Candidatus Omnitrophota bacterium]